MRFGVKASVTRELGTHLEDKSQELRETGLSEDEANNIATESFGPPQLIAQQIYEVHSQGTWQEAFFAVLPHLLVALLFASYYWQNIICLSIILVALTCIVIYGWCHNKPMWFFPWLGYYLLPVILTGMLLIYLPHGWVWLATLAYFPLALFAFAYTHVRQRWCKAATLLIPPSVILVSVTLVNRGNIGFWGWLILLFSLFALASPAWLQARL